jgi:hypothetical protein
VEEERRRSMSTTQPPSPYYRIFLYTERERGLNRTTDTNAESKEKKERSKERSKERRKREEREMSFFSLIYHTHSHSVPSLLIGHTLRYAYEAIYD